ncbi:MAG: hypothetical protein HYY02_06660 [Chloroflexi bacterium]|nr:hypothetical protein [Chloroflexota bacterium]
MSAPEAGAQDVWGLEQLIRRSRAMDQALKRQWLRVLPYLTPGDRARLYQALVEGQAPSPTEQAAARSQ